MLTNCLCNSYFETWGTGGLLVLNVVLTELGLRPSIFFKPLFGFYNVLHGDIMQCSIILVLDIF